MTTNRQDDGVLPLILGMLREECEKGDPLVSEQTFSVAVQTLLRIFRNVQSNPTDEKYRSIRVQNAAFAQKVWRHDGSQQFLQATGWVIVDESLYLTDDSQIQNAIDELQKHAATGTGQASGQPAPQTTAKTKQMDEARQKQLEQMKKEKEERKRIADKIRADRQETNSREFRDIRARERNFGAQIKRFGDIGVDLNSGGG